MKLKIKRFIYLANDLTNALLKKNQSQLINSYKKMRLSLIIAIIILILSLALNFYFYYL